VPKPAAGMARTARKWHWSGNGRHAIVVGRRGES